MKTLDEDFPLPKQKDVNNMQSDSIANLAASLAKAQPLIEGAIKDKTNPHFRSQYADLGNVVDAIKPAIAKHGLSFIQRCHDNEAGAKVETLILHESGEWISCGIIAVPASKHDAQGFGSALTYARRYSLSAAFGVAPEDDDGNAASKKKQAPLVAQYGSKIADYIEAGDTRGAVEYIETLGLLKEQKVAIWQNMKPEHKAAIEQFNSENKG